MPRLNLLLLLLLSGCLPGAGLPRILLPDAAALSISGSFAAGSEARHGLPSGRTGRDDGAAWSAMLVGTWRPAAVQTALPVGAMELEPDPLIASDLGSGSGLAPEATPAPVTP